MTVIFFQFLFTVRKPVSFCFFWFGLRATSPNIAKVGTEFIELKPSWNKSQNFTFKVAKSDEIDVFDGWLSYFEIHYDEKARYPTYSIREAFRISEYSINTQFRASNSFQKKK